jgi:hypothetical protein
MITRRKCLFAARLAGFVAVGIILSWGAWRWYRYAAEERVIAALKKQGAGVQRWNGGSLVDEIAGIFRGPHGVNVLVMQPGVDLALASKLPDLYALHLVGGVVPERKPIPLSERDVSAVSEMTQLETLSLDRVAIPPSFCSVLPRLRKLNWLFLQRVEVGDEGTSMIAKVRGLTRLYLDESGVTDEGLFRLRGLEKLRELSLGRSHISARGVRHLQSLPSLSDLNVAGCGLTDTSLAALNYCVALTTLDVSDNPITDKGLEILSRMPHLGVIHLNRTKITDAGLQCFAQQTHNGRSLDAIGTAVTATGVARLRAQNPLMAVRLGK